MPSRGRASRLVQVHSESFADNLERPHDCSSNRAHDTAGIVGLRRLGRAGRIARFVRNRGVRRQRLIDHPGLHASRRQREHAADNRGGGKSRFPPSRHSLRSNAPLITVSALDNRFNARPLCADRSMRACEAAFGVRDRTAGRLCERVEPTTDRQPWLGQC